MESETMQQLESTIESIVENYAIVERIALETATYEDIVNFSEHMGMTDDRLGELTPDKDDASTWDWMGLHDDATEAAQDYPLSIDDSHVWFTLGGPNISANVTGWRVNVDGSSYWVDVQDITLKGRWGGDSVDVDLFASSPTTGPAFRAIAEMFEMNLLMKFHQY